MDSPNDKTSFGHWSFPVCLIKKTRFLSRKSEERQERLIWESSRKSVVYTQHKASNIPAPKANTILSTQVLFPTPLPRTSTTTSSHFPDKATTPRQPDLKLCGTAQVLNSSVHFCLGWGKLKRRLNKHIVHLD